VGSINERLKSDEHLPCEDLESALGVARGVDRLDCVAKGFDPSKPGSTTQRCWIESEFAEVILSRFDSLQQCLYALFEWCDDLLAPVALVIAQCVLRKCRPQAL
jgi:hypothetical protein